MSRRRPVRILKGVTLLSTLGVACALAWVLEPYTLTRVGSALYLAVAVASLVLLTGLNGQISIGQAAFMGVGAYTTVILVSDYAWPYWGATLAAVLVAAFTGVVLALPALRLRGLYVALITLGIALVFPTLIQRFDDFTGGTAGKTATALLEVPAWTGLTLEQWTYFVLLFLTVLALAVVRNLKVSRVGRAMIAIRDHDRAAETFGVPLAFTKVTAFGISAGLAGLAGAMFVMHRQFVSPTDFGLLRSIDFFVGMAVGGPTSVLGAVAGGGFLEFAPTAVESVGVDPLLTPLLYGALLIASVYVLRDGVGGALTRLSQRLAALFSDTEEATASTDPPEKRAGEASTGLGPIPVAQVDRRRGQ